MKLEYKIPKGFAQVMRGALKKGDLFPCGNVWLESEKKWPPVEMCGFVIRRIKKGGRK